MVQTHEYLLQALNEAIRMELEGRQYYLEAAARTGCTQTRQALEYLAESETRHIEKFTAVYQSLQKDPAWTENMAECEPPPFRPDIFVGPVAGDEQWEGMEGDFEIMRTVLRLEQQGIDYYANLSEKVTNPLACRFFLSLADEERDHHNLIEELISFLELNYCKISAADEEGRDF